jgi:hypothetical protein
MIGISVAFTIAGALSMGMGTPTMARRGSRPSPLLLAIKWVSYSNHGQALISRSEVDRTLRKVNRLYEPCGVRFRLERYVASDESRWGLPLHPSQMKELDQIREHYDDGRSLVVISTGKWDHQGGLGADGANAWTTMPGQKPTGTVIEGPVSKMAGLIAHELGHALNLDHVGDEANLMNPVIYPSSKTLDSGQCAIVRETAISSRAEALRSVPPRGSMHAGASSPSSSGTGSG